MPSEKISPPPRKDTSSTKGKKLLDQTCTELVECVRETLQAQHYSFCTEKTCIDWCRRFILFHNPGLSRGEVKRHPKEMGNAEVEVFITHLATERKVAAR